MAQGQTQLDSLRKALTTLHGEDKIVALIDLSYYASKVDFEGSKRYGDEAVLLARDLNDDLLLGKAYKELANTYMHANQLETAIDLNQKSLETFKKINDHLQISGVLNNLGSVYRRKADFSRALDYYFRSLKLKDSLGATNLASTFGNIGHVYRQKGEPEKALEYFFKSLEIEISENDKPSMAIDYSNIGTAYENAESYKLAIEYANKALALDRELGDEYGIAIDYNNLGEAHYGMKDYLKAKAYFNMSMKIKEKIGNSNGVAHSSQRLSSLFTDTKEYDSALYYATKSLEIVSRNGNRERKMKNYKVLTDIYHAKGEPYKALEYHKKYELLKDTIFNLEKEVLAADMESKYQAAKKDNVIANQKVTITQQKQLQLLYIILAISLLAVAFLLFYGYRKRQLQNRKLSRLNEELDVRNQQNELLLKEIHHRVKNNLEMVKSLIALQSAHLEDSKTRDAMIASQNRVQSMGIIHQKLYQGDNLGSIEMKDYFINLGEGILDSFKAEDKIQIECVMDDLELDIDTAVPLGLIVNELLTNAIKYAFPDKEDGVVQVSLKKEQDVLILDVIDNGVGKQNKESPHGTGFGSELVKLLTTQLNGVMKEEAMEGTHLSFEFKLDTAA